MYIIIVFKKIFYFVFISFSKLNLEHFTVKEHQFDTSYNIIVMFLFSYGCL